MATNHFKTPPGKTRRETLFVLISAAVLQFCGGIEQIDFGKWNVTDSSGNQCSHQVFRLKMKANPIKEVMEKLNPENEPISTTESTQASQLSLCRKSQRDFYSVVVD